MKRTPPKQKTGKPDKGVNAGPLHYKVVELSTVDEGALERTLNEWVAQGWHLEGVQFAMRESSKRPAMAFVFFTRQGAEAPHDLDAAARKLRRLASVGSPRPPPAILSPRQRLAQLAGLDDNEGSP